MQNCHWFWKYPSLKLKNLPDHNTYATDFLAKTFRILFNSHVIKVEEHFRSLTKIFGIIRYFLTLPYPLQYNPRVLIFKMGFWVRFYLNLTYLGF